MSLTGKNAKSIRKSEYKESRNVAQGFEKLVFAHKASSGDTGIDLSSLSTPTEMSTLGFTNPSPSRLTEAKLFQFKQNLTLISSLRGVLQQDLSYRVSSNSRITLEGFTAQEGEIFTGIIDANPTSGINVVDAKMQTAQGDLADGNTDFAIGFTTKTTSEEIVVFRNGLQQKRNSNNSSTVEDGNYFVVDSGSGFGSVIRFNTAASGSADFIFVSSIGNIIESPTDSSWDEIEKLQGQIDDMVPTLASIAGVPESTFQAQPNNPDLKQFGDIVTQNKKDLEREWNSANFFEEIDETVASVSFTGGTETNGISNFRMFGTRTGKTYTLGFEATVDYDGGSENGFDTVTIDLTQWNFLSGKSIEVLAGNAATNANEAAANENTIAYFEFNSSTSMKMSSAGKLESASRLMRGTIVIKLV